MTKVSFKNSVIVFAIGVVMVSCGGRGGNQQSKGEALEKAIEGQQSEATTSSQSGPFGLNMGMTLAQVKSVTGKNPELVRDDLYEVTPPNPHDMFESYIVQISPKYGVVWIKAIGKDITTNGHGTQLTTAFDNLVSSIERTYGEYKRTDFLSRGSIWNEPNDFMMGLLKKDRYLMAAWENEYGSTLPDNLKSIGVIATAISSTEGYISLEYSSQDEEKVDAEKKAKQDSVF